MTLVSIEICYCYNNSSTAAPPLDYANLYIAATTLARHP